MAAPKSKLSPSQELMARIMRIVRTCPDAASEVLELMFLVSQIEAATGVDREYRDAKRVISRLRNPLWEMGPSDREKLLAAAETIRRVCRLAEAQIPAGADRRCRGARAGRGAARRRPGRGVRRRADRPRHRHRRGGAAD